MGRPRGSTKKSSETTAADSKSKSLDKPTRATREKPRKSYREADGSDEERVFDEPPPSSPEEIPDPSEDSDVDFDEGDSSGSEYGKKKKGVKAKGRGSVAKGKSVSPAKKGRGRGRPPASASKAKPGRKAASPAAASGGAKRGRKPAAAKSAANGSKKKRPAESSDDDVEEKVQSSDEEEEEMSEENSDSDFEKDSSGSEYGKKAKKIPKMKKETPSRLQPKRATGTGGNKRGRKPAGGGSSSSATNGSSSKKIKLDKEVIDKKEKDKEDKSAGSEDDDEESPMKIDEDKVDTASSADDDEPVKPTTKKETEATTAKKNDKEKVEEKDKKEVEKSEEEEDEEDDVDDVASEEEEKKPKDKEPAALKNRTDTDLSKINFACDKKSSSGEAWNFKIACWNVGGIKSWVKKNGLDYVEAENPDILCLQEIKCNEKTKPTEVEKLSKDYPHVSWSYAEQAGHHGVATFSKTKPISVSYGIPVADDDSEADKKLKEMFNKEGRLIVSEFEKFYLLNAYVPNSGRPVKDDKPGSKPYPPKITNGERPGWDKLFTQYVKKLDETKPVIVTGDLNVAHEEIDLANPKTNTSNAGFTKEERENFTQFLKEAQVFDSFRSLNPEAKGAYTFWSFMNNSRAKNVGWRLDYFLLSEKLKGSLCENVIRSDVFGSDHCPIVLFTHF